MDFQLALATGVKDLSLPMGTWTGGGGPRDVISIPGFPQRLFTVRVSPGLATLECQVPLVMGVLPLPRRVERLWMPGEVLTLSRSVRLRRCEEPPPRPSGLRDLAGDTDTWPTRSPTLVCIMGDGLGRTWCLSNRELQLGRASNAHVRLHAPTVSRVHAALVQHRSHWLLVPHHSKNPTRLNGRPLSGARELSHGDIIEVGAVALRFQRPWTPPPTVSAPSCASAPRAPQQAARTAVISRELRRPKWSPAALAGLVRRALAW